MKLHMLRCIAAVLGIVALSCGDQQEAPAEKKLKIAGIVFQEDQFFRPDSVWDAGRGRQSGRRTAAGQ